MHGEPGDLWDSLWSEFEALRAAVGQSKAQNVNAKGLRDSAKALVQSYFRLARPHVVELGVDETQLVELDGPMQELLRLANGLNNKRSYSRTLDAIRRRKPDLDIRREMLLGRQVQKSRSAVPGHTELEQMILDTLDALLPSAALSYEQALRDLAGAQRLSYRGTAVELRECLRELLDHLAPDAAVAKTPGFAYEKGLTRPSMKQKARFILKNRGGAQSSLSSAQDAVLRIEEASAALARSVYMRGSVSTHVATTMREVRELKLYADAVLAELLEILGPKAAR
jgi:Predicted pPIWI-associating nuclease